MPAVRVVTPPGPGRPPVPAQLGRVLLYAPPLYEMGFKQHHIDGEALALHAYLRAAGYDCTLLDAYYRGRRTPTLDELLAAGRFDVVVVHLWTSDAYGSRLRRIADELAAARRAHGAAVLGFGPLATSAAADLHAHGAIEAALGPTSATTAVPPPLAGLAADVTAHLRVHTPLATLTSAELGYRPDAVVSVSASRGCRSRCTFCAYNADLGGGWQPLPMPAVVADIAHLHRLTGATRFAFADTDFGGTREACRRRAAELRDALTGAGLSGVVRLSMNIRSETLDPATVAILAEAGVRTFLIGVESFDPVTLHRCYGKRMDLAHLREVVAAADAHAITTVASYILWHPWQSPASLRRELDAIEEFGRWRIPQFMARSRLLVIPGTAAERQVRAAGLLEQGRFHRGFRFADPRVGALHDELAGWFTHTALPVIEGLSEQRAEDMATLARLKIDEWELLTALASSRTPAPAAGRG